MIKRLKWNVIHYDDVDDGDEKSSSDESGTEAEALQNLIDNDLDLKALRSGPHADQTQSETRRSQLHKDVPASEEEQSDPESEGSASSGREDAGDNRAHGQGGRAHTPDGPKGQGFLDERKKCVLCSKQFYNDNDFELHISSKRHLEALRKQNNSRIKQDLQKQVHETDRRATIRDNDSRLESRLQDFVKASASKLAASPNLSSASGSAQREDTSDRETGLSAENKENVRDDDGEDRVAQVRTEQVQTEHGRVGRTKRRKAATKRKLKALKRRKWEKQRQNVAGDVVKT